MAEDARAGRYDAAPKVLVVEDSPSARKIMQELLLRLGMTLPDLRLAGTVSEALQTFTQWRPDIVFVDVELRGPDPGAASAGGTSASIANGAELATHFLSRNPGLKVVVCSAGDPSDPRLATLLKTGKVEFILKPVMAAKVEEVLNRLRGPTPARRR